MRDLARVAVLGRRLAVLLAAAALAWCALPAPVRAEGMTTVEQEHLFEHKLLGSAALLGRESQRIVHRART